MGSLARRLRRKATPRRRQRETTMAKQTIDLRHLERLPTGKENGKPGPLGIMLHSTGKEPIRDETGEQARVTIAAYVKQCIRSPAFVAATGLKDQLKVA